MHAEAVRDLFQIVLHDTAMRRVPQRLFIDTEVPCLREKVVVAQCRNHPEHNDIDRHHDPNESRSSSEECAHVTFPFLMPSRSVVILNVVPPFSSDTNEIVPCSRGLIRAPSDPIWFSPLRSCILDFTRMPRTGSRGVQKMTLHNGWRLCLLGFLTLFLELVLIRYLAGNIWNLGYFPNLVLLAVFFGMGIGFVLYTHPVVPGLDTWNGEIAGELFFTATNTRADGGSLWVFLACFLAI